MINDRRRFIAKAGGVMAAAATAAIVDAPYVIAQPKVQWRMSTTWTPALDVLQGGAQRLAKVVEEACHEFGIRYSAHKTFLAALVSHYKHLALMARPTPMACEA